MDIKNYQEILKLHDQIIQETGGKNGLRDLNSLLSSLGRPFSGSSKGIEYFPTVLDKAAALIHSINKNHPFVDGNKRTSALITIEFLRQNKYQINSDNDEIVEFVLDIANNKIDLEQIKDWIAKRITKLEV